MTPTWPSCLLFCWAEISVSSLAQPLFNSTQVVICILPSHRCHRTTRIFAWKPSKLKSWSWNLFDLMAWLAQTKAWNICKGDTVSWMHLFIVAEANEDWRLCFFFWGGGWFHFCWWVFFCWSITWLLFQVNRFCSWQSEDLKREKPCELKSREKIVHTEEIFPPVTCRYGRLYCWTALKV